MNNKRNYAKELEELAGRLRKEGKTPSLLVHACCAPCSSACLELLREYFRVTVFYYNPNITEAAEYEFRKSEELRLIEEYNRQVREQDFGSMHATEHALLIDVLEAPYDPESFLECAKGLEEVPEGGARCRECFALRLGRTAEYARDGGFDFFTTTLTISPLKNAAVLNEIGEREGERTGVPFLPSDFKKKDGYKRSIELSAEYSLYRQNYCGCSFSRRAAETGGNSN